MATEKQLEANRLNALKSTGPKTDEGKEQSRRNALKHGLAGAGVVLPHDEAEVAHERWGELHSSFKPINTHEVYLAEQIGIESVRIERCQWLQRERQKMLSDRALDGWDEDRRIEAEELGAKLAKEPGLVARRLPQSPQGCDWLVERWEGLARALGNAGGWTAEQRRLALDLLGTPLELRVGLTAIDPEDPAESRNVRAGIVAAEVERLARRRATQGPRDEAEQRLAVAGGREAQDAELALLRRYEAACQRRKVWSLKQFKAGRHNYAPVLPPDRPAYTPPPPPPPEVATAPPPLHGGATGLEEESVPPPPPADTGAVGLGLDYPTTDDDPRWMSDRL